MTNDKHTISSGLRRCKQLAGDIANLTARAALAVSFDEASPPAYTYAECAVRRAEMVSELVELRTKIATANALTKLGDGQPLVSAVQRLAQIKSDISFLKTLPCAVQERTERTRWDVDYEVLTAAGNPTRVKRVDVTICALTERQRDDAVEALQTEFSELNAQVEHLNHITVLP